MLNTFNLLPFVPLDGGYYLEAILFSRSPKLRVLSDAAASLILALIAVATRTPILGIIAFFVFLSLRFTYFSSKIAVQIKQELAEQGAAEPNAVESEALRNRIPSRHIERLIPVLAVRFPKRNWTPKQLAEVLERIWNMVWCRPPSARATVCLLLLYLVTLGAGILATIEAALPRWEEGFLALREMVYGDRPFNYSSIPVGDDSLLTQAMTAIEAGEYRRARAVLEAVPSDDKRQQDVWYLLMLARARQMGGDLRGAKQAAARILELPGPEASRTQLAGWAALRELGERPGKEDAGKVLAVVVEKGEAGGVILIAGYADGNARIWNSRSPGGIVGDLSTNPEVKRAADRLVKAGETSTVRLPIASARPLPAQNRVRFAILTPAGMHVADEAEAEVSKQAHPLNPLYKAAVELSTTVDRSFKATRTGQRPQP